MLLVSPYDTPTLPLTYILCYSSIYLDFRSIKFNSCSFNISHSFILKCMQDISVNNEYKSFK